MKRKYSPHALEMYRPILEGKEYPSELILVSKELSDIVMGRIDMKLKKDTVTIERYKIFATPDIVPPVIFGDSIVNSPDIYGTNFPKLALFFEEKLFLNDKYLFSRYILFVSDINPPAFWCFDLLDEDKNSDVVFNIKTELIKFYRNELKEAYETLLTDVNKTYEYEEGEL